VEDLEAVVAAAGLDRFALHADEASCHPAIHYAARHPERVTHLIITGGFARGVALRGYPPAEMAKRVAEATALEHGLEDRNPGFRLLNLARMLPDATAAEMAALEDWYRNTYSGRQAVRFQRSVAVSDVSALAAQLRCPTLVVHSVGDVRNPMEEGRRLAALIPGARFRPVDSGNYMVLPSDPAFREVMEEMRAFLDGDSPAGERNPLFAGLTPRQRDVLELLAQGLDNLQIAARLDVSEKTVRNTITPIFETLGVENRPQAIVKAREAGFGVVSRPRPR
jgi:DNA-binding CsgD family transcriptional regulator/pimeloyl-ACP methyl ester carboxylesterase